MNRLRCFNAVVVTIAAIAIIGCKSKQEAPSGAQAPAQPNAVKSISGQSTAGVVASSPKDKGDAEITANRVLGQMESGDFAVIYQEASPTFKSIGKQEDFVSRFSQTRQKTGPLKNATQASFVTLNSGTFVAVYHMENEKWKTERRLTFGRNKSGKMELMGLNQHDEPKVVAATGKSPH